MRAKTMFTKLDDGQIEKEDELTGKKEIISFDEIAKEYMQFLNDLHSDNYKKLIGDYNESKNKLSYLFFNYTKLIDALCDDHDENIYFLKSGCIFYDELKFATETGEQITVKSDSPHEEILKYHDEIRRVLNEIFISKKDKADRIFFEITNKVDKGENIDGIEMLKLLNEINGKVTKSQKPQWILDAIEERKLEKDGKTLRVSTEEMAEWLFLNEVEGVDTNFMINNFRLKIRHSTAQQAVSRGKPDYLKKKEIKL
ncbi:MAG: hypothetical protein LBI12_08445 [Treponema sp.]|nr:hypothetical protein [Treponema sp.]